MHKHKIWKKGLIWAVIILLIGVATAPIIAGEVNSLNRTQKGFRFNSLQNEELIKITVTVTDSDGVKEHIVMLTQQQENELNLLIDNYKVDLGIAETMEETKEVYLDMIKSLYNLGIYPDDMSVEDVSQIIFDDTLQVKDDVDSDSTFGMNKNCLISGETTWTYRTFFKIGIGLHFRDMMKTGLSYHYPGAGWIETSGEMGDKSWESNDIWGEYWLNVNAGFRHHGRLGGIFYFSEAIRGFRGTSIITNEDNWQEYYQGRASEVKVRVDGVSYSSNNNQNIQTSQQSMITLFLQILQRPLNIR